MNQFATGSVVSARKGRILANEGICSPIGRPERTNLQANKVRDGSGKKSGQEAIGLSQIVSKPAFNGKYGTPT